MEDNILFGKEMDETWFNRVTEACALHPDLETFPAGQKSEIGEKVLPWVYVLAKFSLSSYNLGVLLKTSTPE